MERISDIMNSLNSFGMKQFFCEDVSPIFQYDNYETEIKIDDFQVFNDPSTLSLAFCFFSEIKKEHILLKIRDKLRRDKSEEYNNGEICSDNGLLTLGNKVFNCRCQINNNLLTLLKKDYLLTIIDIPLLEIQMKGIKGIFGSECNKFINKKEKFTRFEIMDI